MDGNVQFRYRARRRQIDETAARLARRKRVVVARSTRLGETLYGKLTSPAAFIVAGSAGYLVGELSRPRVGTEPSPSRKRPPRSLLNEATLWLKTALVLVNWTHAMLDTPVAPPRSGEQGVPHPTPPTD